MPPLIFQLVGLVVALGGLATAAFPRKMTSYRMRGAGGETTVEPTEMRLLFARLIGLVVAVVAGLMAFGGAGLLV